MMDFNQPSGGVSDDLINDRSVLRDTASLEQVKLANDGYWNRFWSEQTEEYRKQAEKFMFSPLDTEKADRLEKELRERLLAEAVEKVKRRKQAEAELARLLEERNQALIHERELEAQRDVQAFISEYAQELSREHSERLKQKSIKESERRERQAKKRLERKRINELDKEQRLAYQHERERLRLEKKKKQLEARAARQRELEAKRRQKEAEKLAKIEERLRRQKEREDERREKRIRQKKRTHSARARRLREDRQLVLDRLTFTGIRWGNIIEQYRERLANGYSIKSVKRNPTDAELLRAELKKMRFNPAASENTIRALERAAEIAEQIELGVDTCQEKPKKYGT